MGSITHLLAVKHVTTVKNSLTALLLLLAGSCAAASIPIDFNLNTLPDTHASRAWPVITSLPAPDGLRPCCAFGYNLHVKVYGIPVPFYRIHNILEVGQTGHHHYNDSSFETFLDIMDLGAERNGIIYTRHGGFIDTAHIRDSADMTLYIFSQLWPRLGQGFTLQMTDELAQRQLVFFPFTPPESAAQRYTLAAWLSAKLAFEIAAWHEVAQWYGFESVAGFSEGISAFSPEDLYSNLVGTRIAATLILSGHAASLGMYDAAMDTLLSQALKELGAVSAAHTQFHFDMLDSVWWNSQCAVPDKFLLLKRNYLTSDDRMPTPEPRFHHTIWRLALPDDLYGYHLTSLAQLRLLPGKHMKRLPAPDPWYTATDFPTLAQYAQQQDGRELPQIRQRLKQNPASACR